LTYLEPEHTHDGQGATSRVGTDALLREAPAERLDKRYDYAPQRLRMQGQYEDSETLSRQSRNVRFSGKLEMSGVDAGCV
jgi:hypothetical protein